MLVVRRLLARWRFLVMSTYVGIIHLLSRLLIIVKYQANAVLGRRCEVFRRGGGKNLPWRQRYVKRPVLGAVP
jgi:hypothetical protein